MHRSHGKVVSVCVNPIISEGRKCEPREKVLVSGRMSRPRMHGGVYVSRMIMRWTSV